MKRLPRLTEEQYLAFEEAISADPRGRAFLRQRDARSRVIAADQVRRLMRRLAITPTREGEPAQPSSAHVRILRQELQEMSCYIQQTRQEIAALRPAEAGSNRIIAATGELDAIVSATERATSDILNCAERIQAAAARLPKTDELRPTVGEIEAQAIEIMTTCSFQDITGQRTTKVVNVLRYIEQRVNSMVQIWSGDAVDAPAAMEQADTRPDAHLLNGPAAAGTGVSQDDIDALFGGFDAPAEEQPAAAPLDQSAIDALLA
jgi:chemotaxis regulatin CheY-phosphate phosphatase CheZ